jgi:hypothetical protein
VNADGAVEILAVAGGFARVIADSTMHRGHGIVADQRLPGGAKIAGLRQIEPSLDILRKTIRETVRAQDQRQACSYGYGRGAVSLNVSDSLGAQELDRDRLWIGSISRSSTARSVLWAERKVKMEGMSPLGCVLALSATPQIAWPRSNNQRLGEFTAWSGNIGEREDRPAPRARFNFRSDYPHNRGGGPFWRKSRFRCNGVWRT